MNKLIRLSTIRVGEEVFINVNHIVRVRQYRDHICVSPRKTKKVTFPYLIFFKRTVTVEMEPPEYAEHFGCAVDLTHYTVYVRESVAQVVDAING